MGQMKCGYMINQKEVYQKLKQCGHDLTGDFRSIVSASEDGEIAWTVNLQWFHTKALPNSRAVAWITNVFCCQSTTIC
jgi:hypothetical protein